MQSKQICEYLTDIGLIPFENIDDFFEIYSKNSKINKPEKENKLINNKSKDKDNKVMLINSKISNNKIITAAKTKDNNKVIILNKAKAKDVKLISNSKSQPKEKQKKVIYKKEEF